MERFTSLSNSSQPRVSFFVWTVTCYGQMHFFPYTSLSLKFVVRIMYMLIIIILLFFFLFFFMYPGRLGTRLISKHRNEAVSWNSSLQFKICLPSWNSSQLQLVASVEIYLSWYLSLQLQFVASVEICRLKTNAAWRDHRHETAHRLVKCTSTKLLVLTQTAPHTSLSKEQTADSLLCHSTQQDLSLSTI